MSEPSMPQVASQFRPAIGGGGRLPRKILVWEAVIALVLILLLLGAKHVVASREIGNDPLASLPGGRTVVTGMDIGGVPDDIDLEALAASYKVDGLVNLAGPSVAEQVTASSLHLSYLHVPVAPGKAPTRVQLQTLAAFMSKFATHGNYIYLHDDVGGPRAVTAASMLLLLRGTPWRTVQRAVTASQLSTLTSTQSKAIQQLIAALKADGKPVPGNLYSDVRIYPW